ncbi:hypothetical protein RF007C_11115 [Ruminococcus flavefaciens 007c]|uniref:Uncharacterized protein n=1 Tax=Ruminococcus flavefaciens 007c TaxID=1341157 RepID=W7UI31_RUMFL|nr:hypothetical protein RF007C_11115 [Ruminococcus flavefaciens 007c]
MKKPRGRASGLNCCMAAELIRQIYLFSVKEKRIS